MWLKPLQIEQFEQFYQIVATHTRMSRLEVRTILQQSVELFRQFGFGIWGLELKTCGTMVGFAGLWYFGDQAQPQLVYGLLPAWTKQGLATEGARAVLDYSFDVLRFDYLVASCDRANLDSGRVAIRLGMELTAASMIDRQINQQGLNFFTICRSN